MPRVRTTAVAASPAAAAETVVAAIAPAAVPAGEGGDQIDINGVLDITIGTAGTAVTLKIRRGTDTTGTTLATYGPFTAVAGNRINPEISAVDAEAGLGYVLTLTVTSATGATTVNNAYLRADY